MAIRVFAILALFLQLAVTGCAIDQRSRALPSSAADSARRTPSLVVVTCGDPELCPSCNPAFEACEYCDPSLSDCPIVITFGGGGGGGGGGVPTGPACPQQVSGPGGTFDGHNTSASYIVPSFARTGYVMLTSNHVDQVNVEFFLGNTFAGDYASGGTSVAQAGSYTTTVPTNGQFDSTRMTGSWIDKSTAVGHTDLTFTAAASSFC
jgi:hypothetical protein